VTDWSPATRIAFRFAVVYLGLFSLATQIAGSLLVVPGLPFRGLGTLPPMRDVTLWVATSVLGADAVAIPAAATGETIFVVAQTAWILLVAIAVTVAWSRLDRNRPHHASAHGWFRLFVRLALAGQMFEYGLTKVIPNQFEAPSLNVLATPAGDLSLNTLFWTSIGAAPGYQMFTGWFEVLGGALLLLPRTTMLGALVCLAATTHVLVLNLAFDVGLKITTLHLVLLSLVLLAPDARRLVRFLVLDRAPGPSMDVPLVTSPRVRRIALVAPLLFGAYLVGMQTWANVSFWHTTGGGAPVSPLYGIWNVEQLTVDGTAGPPSLNEYDRQWRRVIFDAPDRVTFQRTDDSFARYGADVDLDAGRLALTRGGSRSWRSAFAIRRPSEDRLVLDGEMDGHDIHLRLERVPLDSYRLVNSPFRWIRTDAG
jgi:uncharacterized membrane protein YphA (DoxX/SURF4 family)